jgi:hypothetical protein
LKAERRSRKEKIMAMVNCTSRKDDFQDVFPVKGNEGLYTKGVGHGFGGKSRRIKPESEHKEVPSEETALETGGTQVDRWRDQLSDFACRNP